MELLEAAHTKKSWVSRGSVLLLLMWQYKPPTYEHCELEQPEWPHNFPIL